MFEFLLYCMTNKNITEDQLKRYVPIFITTSEFEKIMTACKMQSSAEELNL